MMKSAIRNGKVLALAGATALVAGLAFTAAEGNTSNDPFASLPANLELSATIRDVRERTNTGGHPDFERQPTAGFGQFALMVADTLDQDGKPVFRSTGRKVNSVWKDSSNRPIIDPRSYIASRSGDVAGSMASTDGGALTTSTSFGQWYRDVPGTNASRTVKLKLVRNANSNTYTFNDRTDAHYTSLGGFFPIDGELLGNSGGSTPNKNFHFTTEIDTEFVYQRNSNQVFTFTGDDDVWVFIDNKLVVDIGGVHSAVSQTIDLDRLTWLEDGRSYRLKIFHAERHRTQSNFRIDTTLRLRTVQPPAVNGLFD